MSKIIQFLKEVKVELAKVVWPSKKEALKTTTIVILFSLLVAAFLGLIDYGLTRVISLIVER